jgi:hypothetical protein
MHMTTAVGGLERIRHAELKLKVIHGLSRVIHMYEFNM